MKNPLENLGTGGAILAAAACPVCFPKLALLGSLFGMGALAPFEGILFWLAQTLVVLVLVGAVFAFKKTGNITLLLLTSVCVVLFFLSLYVFANEWLSYLALFGLVGVNLRQIWQTRKRAGCATAQASNQ